MDDVLLQRLKDARDHCERFIGCTDRRRKPRNKTLSSLFMDILVANDGLIDFKQGDIQQNPQGFETIWEYLAYHFVKIGKSNHLVEEPTTAQRIRSVGLSAKKYDQAAIQVQREVLPILFERFGLKLYRCKRTVGDPILAVITIDGDHVVNQFGEMAKNLVCDGKVKRGVEHLNLAHDEALSICGSREDAVKMIDSRVVSPCRERALTPPILNLCHNGKAS